MKTVEQILQELKRNEGDYQGICQAISLLGQLLVALQKTDKTETVIDG